MFSDPQFWVAVSFFLFIAAIFNPVRKLLISALDSQINEIKLKIDESENLKNEAQKTLSDLKKREAEVENEIKVLKTNSEKKISELKVSSEKKLMEQVEKRKQLSEIKIEQLLRDTNIKIKNYISEVAIEATLNILKNNLSEENKSNLINESINDLNKVLKN
tara:strand:+ start:607 stop:1092 length:486 start_codon:yes stop_codon:yes gene_type:complete